MRIELESKLREEFPTVFSDVDVECGDGWYEVLRKLCAVLEPKGVAAEQVKEKFGCLRFYGSDLDEEAWRAISLAENESETICEVCGKPGQLRPGKWLVVRCDEHDRR